MLNSEFIHMPGVHNYAAESPTNDVGEKWSFVCWREWEGKWEHWEWAR